MRRLTLKEKRFYINDGGQKCPYCHSTKLRGGEFDHDLGNAMMEVWCNKCKKRWNELYEMTSIEEN